MTEEKAKQIGSRQALKSVGIGLLIAQLIMTYLSSNQGYIRGFFWFTTIDFKLNIFIGAIIMLWCGHFFGQITGKEIIIKKRNFILVGLLCGIVVLLTTAILSGLTGFLDEGVGNIGTNDNPFEDYFFKPFYWITMFGIIPACLVAIWFGKQIKKREHQFENPMQT